MPGSGEAGTSTNYRLRGAGSLYAGNNPTIYVDGVRVNGRGQGNYTVFGQNTSSLDAINPNDIESIEVIKGPAAATLYGAEAAAGVIQIITKKAATGPSSLGCAHGDGPFNVAGVDAADQLCRVDRGPHRGPRQLSGIRRHSGGRHCFAPRDVRARCAPQRRHREGEQKMLHHVGAEEIVVAQVVNRTIE